MQQTSLPIVITVVLGTLIFISLALFVVLFLSFFYKKQTQNLQEKQALKTAYDQEILKSQIEVQNQTLQHIGQELHDNIGQLLSVAKINLNVLEESDNIEHESIKQTNEIITQSINDLRALTKSLDGDFVHDFGLEESISHELQRIRKTKRFQTEISVLGEKRKLGYEREIVLFRIVQEVLNNAIKHSKAKKINITLHYFSNNFELSATDNGKGFDISAIETNNINSSGAGLRNIQRRMDLIGGQCKINSVLGEGTQILLKL
ncbi:ATP-binding protein [Arcicella sp. LKC2W]|uniref:sensor histidine kinase n=1 Tax=Arcicella sp. LKC2W TaxID=2984198 RepID=UPI002B216C2E|nr:ATP-binding protein [Arcicella sp. LKC2W]MEA5459908.1 ATP-binding protein [Arcicella sp. LKC2W]